MALHISAKLCTLGIVLASLVTAFSADREETVPLAISPHLTLLEEPRADLVGPTPAQGPVANPVHTVRATGYNSMASQTDASPTVTATGTTTRPGVLAVSRDLLGGDLPYGSMVRLRDLGAYRDGRDPGRFQSILDGQGLFIVEDTMHPRKRQQIDVWFGDRRSALNWGVREVRVEVIRYGYDGPVLDRATGPAFEGRPILAAGLR